MNTSNTKDWFGKWAVYQPTKIAVTDYAAGQSMTYLEINEAANRLVNYFLSELNLQKGDRVAVLSDFNLPYIVLFAVAQKLGIILLPLNYRLSGRELNFLLEDSGAITCIVSEKYLELIRNEASYVRCTHRLTIAAIEEIYQSTYWPTDAVAVPPVSEDHPLFILYTSGTTGFPKGALYTHRMAFWNAINTSLRMDLTSKDHTIICMPPFHTGGWNVFLTPFLYHGASVGLLPKFEANQVLELLESERATLFMAVPTMLKMMAEASQFHQVSLECMRYFIVGGEAMPIPLIEKWATKEIPIRQGFGMTEVGPNLTSLDEADAIRKKGSIGIPNFYVETKLVNEVGEEVGVNEIGELLVKGPMVTPGYWQNEEATTKAFQDGWFRTGDLLRRDEEGYLFVMDRLKNMFISGGENVYPAELEHFFRTHEAIVDVAIIGVAHPKWGEVGAAFIVTNDHDLNEAVLKQFCEGKLARYKIPKHYVFLPELPKNPTGKIDKRALQKLTESILI